MKTTLEITNSPIDGKKLFVAARISNVKLGLRTEIGPDASLIEVDYRDAKDLYKMGKLVTTVSGNEFDAQLKAEAEKEKAKAAAAKK